MNRSQWMQILFFTISAGLGLSHAGAQCFDDGTVFVDDSRVGIGVGSISGDFRIVPNDSTSTLHLDPSLLDGGGNVSLPSVFDGSALAFSASEPAEAAVPVVRVTRFNHEAWSGLDLDALAPDWNVESARVVAPTDPETGEILPGFEPFVPSGSLGSTGSTGSILLYNDNSAFTSWSGNCEPAPPTPPVELLDSDQATRVGTHAVVRSGNEAFEADNGTSDNGSGSLDSRLAYIANVFDPDDIFLAGASALAYQTSQITTTQINASGAVAAEGLLDSGVQDGEASSDSRSGFFSSFRLNQSHDFALEVEVAVTENVAVAIMLEDDNTGDVIYTADPSIFDQETGAWSVLVEGFLPPGEYTVRAEALTDASINSTGDVDFGGEALFDLDLRLTLLQGVSESAFLQAVSPEPTTLVIFAFGGVVLLHRRRPRCRY